MSLLGLQLWLLRTALGGSLVLLAACLISRLIREPARRQRLIEGAVFGALVVAGAAVLPSWLWVDVKGGSEVARALEWPAERQAAPVDEHRNEQGLPPEAQDQNGGRMDCLDTDEIEALAPVQATLGDGARGESTATRGAVSTPLDVGSTSVGLAAHAEVDHRTIILTSLSAAYALGALFFLCRVVLGWLALRRVVRTAVADLAPVLADGTFGRAKVLVSEKTEVPFSFGLCQPTIVIPLSLCQPARRHELHWVLRHELTHLRRRDGWGALLLSLAQVIYYYSPCLWWLRRQERLCQEYIADAAAAPAIARADYAEFLLSMTRRRSIPAAALGVSGKPSDLFRRIRMLLDNRQLDSRCPKWWSLLVAGAFVAGGLALGGVGLRAQAAAMPRAVAAVTADDEKKPSEDEDQPKARTKKRSQPDEGRQAALEALKKALESLPEGESRAEIKRLRERLRGLSEEHEKGEFRNALQAWTNNPNTFFRSGTFAPQAGSGRLGLMVESVSPVLADQLDLPKDHGVVVRGVTGKSAAAKAGIKTNDILLEINGKPLSSDFGKLHEVVKALKKDEEVEVVVLRKGQKKTLTLTVPEEKEDQGAKLPRLQPAQGLSPGIQDGNWARTWGSQQPMQAFGGAQGFGGMQGFGAGFGRAGGSGRGVMISMFRTDDRFTGRHQEGSLVITVTGKVEDGKATVNQITVQDGSSQHKYDSVKEVPEEYRDKARNLVESAEGNATKVNVKTKD